MHTSHDGSVITLRTHFSIDECRARLAAVVDKETIFFSLLGFFRYKPMEGKIRAGRFRIWRKIGYRNPLLPPVLLVVSFHPTMVPLLRGDSQSTHLFGGS